MLVITFYFNFIGCDFQRQVKIKGMDKKYYILKTIPFFFLFKENEINKLFL